MSEISQQMKEALDDIDADSGMVAAEVDDNLHLFYNATPLEVAGHFAIIVAMVSTDYDVTPEEILKMTAGTIDEYQAAAETGNR